MNDQTKSEIEIGWNDMFSEKWKPEIKYQTAIFK